MSDHVQDATLRDEERAVTDTYRESAADSNTTEGSSPSPLQVPSKISKLTTAVSGLNLQEGNPGRQMQSDPLASVHLARGAKSSPSLGPTSAQNLSDSVYSASPGSHGQLSTASYMGGLTGDIHARVLTFQQSRQKSRSNSASNGALNFIPGSIPMKASAVAGGSPLLGSPQSASPSSSVYNSTTHNVGLPFSSTEPTAISAGSSSIVDNGPRANLSRSSSSGSSTHSSSTSTGSNAGVSNGTSPWLAMGVVNIGSATDDGVDVRASGVATAPPTLSVKLPIGDIPSPPTEGSVKPVASFSGALVGNVSAVSLQAKKPSLSQRRGMKLPGASGSKFNTSPSVINRAPATVPLTGPFPGAALNLNLPTSRLARSPQQSQNSESSTVEDPQNPNPVGTDPKSLFSNYRRYLDIKTGSLKFAGKASLHSQGIDFTSGSSFRISLDQLEPLGELGRGNYGTVTKVLHKPTNVIMAMKEIRLELDESKFTQIIMELEILHKCVSPYIVDFYGAFFVEGAVFVCMEYMDGGSLDKIYDGGVEEKYLAVITDSVVRGLKQLKEEHNIIHRDVKPTNILISTSGKVKLCDFGVSGNLVASIAKTNIGCQSYMAPERIRGRKPNEAITYTVESDIWSLGLSILEISQGQYPYPPETYQNIFSQLSAIVDGDAPSLPADKFSPEAIDFVNECLNKVPRLRPSYKKLLAHPWLQKYANQDIDVGQFVIDALARKAEDSVSLPPPRPPLHNGGPEPIS
jgi:mitogen-activated protein kinase kinase